MAVAAVLLLPVGASSQALATPASSARADSIIAAAEAAGAAYPAAERTRPFPSIWDATESWGRAERTCVVAAGMGPVRSGEFTIGGELGGDRPIYPRSRTKIWWAPLHNSPTMDSLIITGERLSSPMRMRQALGTVAFPVGPNVAPAEPEYFFPSGTIIPDWGSWLLVATSDANWGCFIITLGRG